MDNVGGIWIMWVVNGLSGWYMSSIPSVPAKKWPQDIMKVFGILFLTEGT
jgi:hypothetical protein